MAALLRGGLEGDPRRAPARTRSDDDTLPVAAFVVDGVPHALVAARLAVEDAIGVRHGCFCAHPYLTRLLGLSRKDVAAYREDVLRGDRSRMPGAVRASAGLSTTRADIDRLLEAVARIAGGDEPTDRLPAGPPHRGLHSGPMAGALADRVSARTALVLAWMR